MSRDGKTEASILMQDHIGAEIGGDDLNVNGVISEAPPADDIFGMTDYDKKEFGLQPHETYISVRDWESPEWNRADPGRFRQVQQMYQGQARRLKDSDGNYARPHLPGLSDQVLVAVPKELHDQIMAERAEAVQADMAMADPELSRRDGSFDRRDPEHIAAAVEYTRSQLQAIQEQNMTPSRLSEGIIGNTSGMSLEEALRIPKDLRDEEAKRYRQGARYAGMDDDDFAAALAGAKPKASKTYGVGRGLGNENPNSALAQARNRASREQGQRR